MTKNIDKKNDKTKKKGKWQNFLERLKKDEKLLFRLIFAIAFSLGMLLAIIYILFHS